MGNPIENNLPRSRLGSLDSVLFRVPIEEDVQFRNLGDPAAIHLPVELNRKLHSHILTPIMRPRILLAVPPRMHRRAATRAPDPRIRAAIRKGREEFLAERATPPRKRVRRPSGS